MITGTLTINTDKLQSELSDLIELTLRNDEAFEWLSESQLIDIINSMDHAVSCSLNQLNITDLVLAER